MNKKGIAPIIAIIVIIVLVAIIIFGIGSSGSIFNPNEQMQPVADTGYLNKIAETDQSVTMESKWVFYEKSRSDADCRSGSLIVKGNIERPFTWLIKGTDAQLNLNQIQINEYFKSQIVVQDIKAVSSPLSSDSVMLPVEIKKQSADCYLRNSFNVLGGSVPGGIVCKIEFEVQANENGNPTSACYYGLSSITTSTEVLKKGLECTSTQETLCASTERCSAGYCIESQQSSPTETQQVNEPSNDDSSPSTQNSQNQNRPGLIAQIIAWIKNFLGI